MASTEVAEAPPAKPTVSSSQIVIDGIPSATEEEKTRKIETNRTQKVGSPWYTALFWKKFSTHNFHILDLLRMAPYFYWVLVTRLIGLLVLLIVGTILLLKTTPHAVSYGVLGVYLTVQVVSITITLRCMYDACKTKHESQYNFAQFICTVLMEILICPMVPFVVDLDLYVLVDILMAGFVFLNIIYELNLVVWIMALAIAVVMGTGEVIYRTIKRDLQCPRKEMVVLECKYKLYPYVESETNEKLCAICRAPFQISEKICKLKCNHSHVFHEVCIFTALGTHPFCPICRQPPVFL